MRYLSLLSNNSENADKILNKLDKITRKAARKRQNGVKNKIYAVLSLLLVPEQRKTAVERPLSRYLKFAQSSVTPDLFRGPSLRKRNA